MVTGFDSFLGHFEIKGVGHCHCGGHEHAVTLFNGIATVVRR